MSTKLLRYTAMDKALIKKFYMATSTEGCATNLQESNSYRNSLSQNGMSEVNSPGDADCIILNTCGYTTEREKHTLKMLKTFKQDYPDTEIIVGGCLAVINPKPLKEHSSHDFFKPGDDDALLKTLGHDKAISSRRQTAQNRTPNQFSSNDFRHLSYIHRLTNHFRKMFFSAENVFNIKFPTLHNIFETAIVNHEYHGISIGQGCAGSCTFCAIKQAKGHIKSRPLSVILHEFQSCLDQGKDKLWLLGDDIGCYGTDINSSIVELLDKILSINKDFKLVINYIEPYFINKHIGQLLPLLSDKRIININVPIQSGDNQMIVKMGREYEAQETLDNIQAIKKINPNLIVKNNIIVGFPGESWQQFFTSIKTVFYYDVNLALAYTNRPGTRSSQMGNQLGHRQIKLRKALINSFILFHHFTIFMKSLFQVRYEKKTS